MGNMNERAHIVLPCTRKCTDAHDTLISLKSMFSCQMKLVIQSALLSFYAILMGVSNVFICIFASSHHRRRHHRNATSLPRDSLCIQRVRAQGHVFARESPPSASSCLHSQQCLFPLPCPALPCLNSINKSRTSNPPPST